MSEILLELLYALDSSWDRDVALRLRNTKALELINDQLIEIDRALKSQLTKDHDHQDVLFNASNN